MIITKSIFSNMLNSPARQIKGRVELYNGSTLLNIFNYTDSLQSFKVERIGEQSKFFGFGVSQKAEVKIIDRERKITIEKGNILELEFGVDVDYIYTFPFFNVTEVLRDENTNEITVKGFDAISKASEYTVSDLELPKSYTVKEFAIACANLLGLPLGIENVNDDVFNTYYPTGANFEGSEKVRDALDDIAEITGTIYYINSEWKLTFKRLDIIGDPVLNIDKSKYFTLKTYPAFTLQNITSATELGDNITASSGIDGGETQFLRDNAFLELRDDKDWLLENILGSVCGTTITPFDIDWRGNFLLEIGDKVWITTKDDSVITTYLFNDTVNYNGALSQKTNWSYTENKAETATNPSNLGESLKQTFARVDKVNKQIEMVASETQANTENISQLKLDTDTISATVKETSTTLDNEIAILTSKVNATMSAEDVQIAIQKEMVNGTDKVTTNTGFTFNDKGLTVTKSGSEITTQITEDGMTVKNGDAEVLTANNEGVKAIDLQATTYLIVGTNSRFENYGDKRTGCFWIGG